MEALPQTKLVHFLLGLYDDYNYLTTLNKLSSTANIGVAFPHWMKISVNAIGNLVRTLLTGTLQFGLKPMILLYPFLLFSISSKDLYIKKGGISTEIMSIYRFNKFKPRCI